MELSRLKRAASYAGRRAFDVFWAGGVALAFWIAVVTIGPAAQARWFPVVSDFRIVELAQPEPDKIGFRPAFTKNYDCRYLGLTWFVKDASGASKRYQVTVAKEDGTPESGPVGSRLGSMWIVPVKDSDQEMFGLLHHSCGWPFESRSVVGPFKLTKIAQGFRVEAEPR